MKLNKRMQASATTSCFCCLLRPGYKEHLKLKCVVSEIICWKKQSGSLAPHESICWYSPSGNFSSFCRIPSLWASNLRLLASIIETMETTLKLAWQTISTLLGRFNKSQGTTFSRLAMAFFTWLDCLAPSWVETVEEAHARSTSARRRLTQAASLWSGCWACSSKKTFHNIWHWLWYSGWRYLKIQRSKVND